MLKVTLLECILRGFPETILFVWAIYLLTQTPLKYTRILLTATISTVVTFVIRLLPINLGINSFIAIVFLIYLNIKINKIPIKKSISATILIYAIEYLTEIINFIGLQLLKYDINKLFQNPINKIIYASPSLAMLVIIVLIIYYVKRRISSSNANKNI